MFKYVILAAILGLAAAQNVWWPFSYSECSFGTGGLSVKINDLWVDAPIYHPGFHNFRVSAELIRAVNSRVNGTVVMYRTVSGLRAPVTCTIITIDPQTVLSIGSCTYPDLCDLLYTLLGVKDSPDCPQWLVDEGFTCRCPWDFAAGRSVNLEEEIEVTDLAQYGVAWLVSGNFEVNVKASHGTQPAICLDIKAGVSQKPGGK